MILLRSIVIVTFLISSLNILAREDSQQTVERFKARTQAKCGDLQVGNVVDWIRGEAEDNLINEKIGEPRSQGDVGWCYAYAARDLIHYHKGIAPDLGYIVKGYYSTLIGGLFNFFSSNKGEGGFTSTTLKASMKNGICPEYSSSHESPNPDNYRDVTCLDPKIRYSKSDKLIIRRSTHGGRGHPLFYNLDQALNKGKMVGVSYNANGLYYEEYRRSNFFTKTLANHASTIVGRFFHEATQTCRYIIRNSWGTRYNSAIMTPQREGYHTISEEDLSASISEIVYFK